MTLTYAQMHELAKLTADQRGRLFVSPKFYNEMKRVDTGEMPALAWSPILALGVDVVVDSTLTVPWEIRP
jgi:hypothetical protein